MDALILDVGVRLDLEKFVEGVCTHISGNIGELFIVAISGAKLPSDDGI